MRRLRFILAALMALVVIGAGTAFATTRSVQSPDSSGLLPTDKPVEGVLQDRLSAPQQEFGLDLGTAKGYTMNNSTEETVWVAKGVAGSVCLIDDGGSDPVDAGGVACASGSDLPEHGIMTMRVPSSSPEYAQAVLAAQESGLSNAELVEAVRHDTAHLPLVSGPASFVGWIPNASVAAVRLVSSDGRTLTRTSPQDGAWTLQIDDFNSLRPSAQIRFERSDGEAVTVVNQPWWEIR